ncbi:MAG: hypothetical protein PHT59_01215 [Candidatus Omnitrophica bacterium]|nr:hypothetical protein [Candidatus Omnitrophota bacterium]
MVKRCIQLGMVFFFAAGAFAHARAATQPAAMALDLAGMTVGFASGEERISFSFEARATQKNDPVSDKERLARKSLEYFFVGLAVPADKFWVNLNPNEPDALIDPLLKDTDLGRVILAADLRLKKDVAAATNPQTSVIGRQYWDKIYAKAEELGIEERIPLVNRVWIAPEEAQVYETAQELAIIKSPLKVCLESEYFGQVPEAEDPRQKALLEFANELMRSMIIPVLAQKVNDSPSYADLRAVYRALVLAQWYRERLSQRPDSVLRTADLATLGGIEIESGYQPEQIYQEYLASLHKGEYNFSETENGRLDFYLRVITRDYFSGGVDIRATKRLAQATRPSQDRVAYVAEVTFTKDVRNLLAYAKNKVTLEGVSGTLKQIVALLGNLPSLSSLRQMDPLLNQDQVLSRTALSNL